MPRFQSKRPIKPDIIDAIIVEEHKGPMKPEDIPKTMYHPNPERSIFTPEGQNHASRLALGYARNAGSRLGSAFAKARNAAASALDGIEIEIPTGKNKKVIAGFDRSGKNGSLGFYCERNF